MSGTKICLGGLVVALLGLGELHGQNMNYGSGLSGMNPSSPPPGWPASGQVMEPTTSLPTGTMTIPVTPALGEPSSGTLPSSWMLYPKSPGCCGPLVDGPITWEIFLRSGASFNISGGALGTALSTGWEIEGGGRTLFFNPQTDAAWTISVSMSNVNYNRSSSTVTVPHNFVTITPNTGAPATITTTTSDVIIGGLNRTFVNAGTGYECYLIGNASQLDGWSWRVGGEGGGRFGSDRLEYGDLPHDTKDAYGLYAAVDSQVEMPYNGVFLQAGVRLEYDFIWSDILQTQNHSNVQDINLLFSVSVRF